MRSHLFILFFMSLALGDISVKILLHGISEIFLPMLSCRNFMLSQLIFVFIHLEFIFVYGVSWWSSFIFLHVAVQISQHHLLKRLFLLHFMLLLPLSNINWPQRLGFISGLSILFQWFMCLFVGKYQAILITVTLEYSLISDILIPPTLFFFLKIAAAIQGHLWFHINFWNVSSISV